MLLSSTGLTVFEHLCQMKGRTVSIFVQAKGCCAPKKATAVFYQQRTKQGKSKAPRSFSRKPCCEDRSQYLKSNMERPVQKSAWSDFSFYAAESSTLPFMATPVAIFPSCQKTLRFYLYKPPPKATDIRVFIQSFLC
jgi:hypothetical protein